jgi:uncharacterized protein (TIGR00369 family)
VTAPEALSGRELLQGIIDGQIPPPPMAILIGAELVSVGDGTALFRCVPSESTYNPAGVVHGGLLCTLMDFAAACAVSTQLPAGVACTSIEIKVSFFAALRAGNGHIEARGQALRVGRRVAFAEAHAYDAVGELIGHATSSLALNRYSTRAGGADMVG